MADDDAGTKRLTPLIFRLLTEVVFALLVIAVLSWLLIGQIQENRKLAADQAAIKHATRRAEAVATCVNDILATRNAPTAAVNAATLVYRPADDAYNVAEQKYLAHPRNAGAFSALQAALNRKVIASHLLTAATIAQDKNNKAHPLGRC